MYLLDRTCHLISLRDRDRGLIRSDRQGSRIEFSDKTVSARLAKQVEEIAISRNNSNKEEINFRETIIVNYFFSRILK